MDKSSPAARSTSLTLHEPGTAEMPPFLPFFDVTIPPFSSFVEIFRNIGKGIPVSSDNVGSVWKSERSERCFTRRSAYSEDAEILNIISKENRRVWSFSSNADRPLPSRQETLSVRIPIPSPPWLRFRFSESLHPPCQ